MEELLSLKWNNHKSTFLHVLSVLRDKQLYTDATIACEGKFYSVHKLVLSTCSDYFSAMLDRTNCKNPIIVLKDIKCEDLEALLDYMYLGEVNVRQGDLATLIKAAECLRVKGLAVPDDEPPPRKTKSSDSQSRKRDSSRSPPAKRKRHTDVDDVRPMRPQNVDAALVHRPKSPVATISSPSSPLQSRKAPLRPSPTNKISSDQNSLPQGHSSSSSSINSSEQKQEQDASNLSDCFVKVEMVESGGTEVETYDLSSEGAFKEEGGDEGAPSGGGGEEGVGDLSNDLPEFLQQATDPGAYGHTTFVGSSSFQPNEMADWQGDGSNTGFSQVDFESAEGSSQQNAPGMSGSTQPSKQAPAQPALHGDPLEMLLGWQVSNAQQPAKHSLQEQGGLPVRKGGYTCQFCSRWFYRNAEMERHIRTHTGERPFQCPMCPYRAGRKSTLQRHLALVHPQLAPNAQ